MALDYKLRNRRCLICKGKLNYDKERLELVCRADKLAYPVEDGYSGAAENRARPLKEEELPL